MGNAKRLLSLILLALVVVAGFFVGRSIMASLGDTRAELARQQAIADSLQRNDTAMRALVDSLDGVIDASQDRVAMLARERDSLDQELGYLATRYARIQGRLDGMWEVGSVIVELDDHFPTWRGQIQEATRGDGVHALIAPRFFGANVVERMAELQNKTEELDIKNERMSVLEATLAEKDVQLGALFGQRDTLQSSYDILYGEYQVLDGRYQDLLVRKWFQMKVTPNTWVGGGLGVVGGFLIGKTL